jgi:hypothetical protein
VQSTLLRFLTAEEASIDAFMSVSAASPYQDRLREYAESLLRERFTRLGWCVLALDSDVPVARAAFWAIPDAAVPTDLVLIETDWSDPDLTGGRALLAHMHDRAAALGAATLRHHVDSPSTAPQYQEHESARARLLTGSGYQLLRDGLRWRYAISAPDEPVPRTSLAFRSLAEVGEDAFVDAIAATYEGTRDSWMTREIQERGVVGAARSDFADYQELDYLPDWWELAYTEGGKLAGVIMAARIPGAAVIAYVGVAPDQRGRGPCGTARRSRHAAAGGERSHGDPRRLRS